MIYIQTTNEVVTFVHYMPFDETYGMHKTEKELKSTGFLVDAIPKYEGEVPDDKIVELHYNGTEFSYVLIDKPKSKEDETQEKITSLESQLEATNEALLGLMNMVTAG